MKEKIVNCARHEDRCVLMLVHNNIMIKKGNISTHRTYMFCDTNI